MIINYINKEGNIKRLYNIVHVKNINNEKCIATNNNNKEFIINPRGILSIYYKDNSLDKNEKNLNFIDLIIRDKKMSLKSKGLYYIIKSYNKIPNFIINKEKIQRLSADGKSSFSTAWNELVEQGYLKVYKLPNEKGYDIKYEILK